MVRITCTKAMRWWNIALNSVLPTFNILLNYYGSFYTIRVNSMVWLNIISKISSFYDHEDLVELFSMTLRYKSKVKNMIRNGIRLVQCKKSFDSNISEQVQSYVPNQLESWKSYDKWIVFITILFGYFALSHKISVNYLENSRSY